MRVRYLTLAVLTIAMGLVIHFTGSALPRAARDILGDALWAMLLLWLLALIAPTASARTLGIAAIVVCFAVEFSQLIRAEMLTQLRSTTLGHFVLGSDFDARDLVAYSAGVLAALPIHRWFLHLAAKPRPKAAARAQ